MNTTNASTTPDTPRTRCPRCRRPMPMPPGLDAADAERLAGLVLCQACLDDDAAPAPPPAPRNVRLPKDD